MALSARRHRARRRARLRGAPRQPRRGERRGRRGARARRRSRPRGARRPHRLPGGALPADRAAPGVSVASPALELDAGIPGTERTLRVTGIDILRAAILQPQLVLEDRYELLAPDRVFLSAAAAEALGAAKGDTVSLMSGQGTSGKSPAFFFAARRRGVDRYRHGAMALRPAGQLNRIDLRLSGHRSRPGVAQASRRCCRRACTSSRWKPGRGERLSVALLPREPQRARHGGALHRRVPRVLGAGARGGAPARRACAAACLGAKGADVSRLS